MQLEEPTRGELSKAEQERLDALLGAARRFHYWALTLSGLSLLLASLEDFSEIRIPIVEVSTPALQATVAVYILVLALTLASERLFSMAHPWLELDDRRPPFPWIALRSKDSSFGSVLMWLLLPPVLCATATGASVPAGDQPGVTLAFAGVVVVLLPRTAGFEWHLIRKRLDHRGGLATFSIWLLYWYRLARLLFSVGFFFLPVPAVIPKWRDGLLNIVEWCGLALIPLILVRLVAAAPAVYRRIDGFGRRFGFPTESKHYK